MRIIAGRWKGHALKPLKGRNVRPTTDRVRESWMSALGGAIDGADLLDLFSGSGALGLEALSRGAHHVTSVEKARSAVAVIRANAAKLGAGPELTIVNDDVFRFLDRQVEIADIALADPPYQTGLAARLLIRFAERPFARELWLEHPVREELPLPAGARTRRYGDTAITTLVADS